MRGKKIVKAAIDILNNELEKADRALINAEYRWAGNSTIPKERRRLSVQRRRNYADELRSAIKTLKEGNNT